MKKIDFSKYCRNCGKEAQDIVTLKSKTKGKTITFCEKCFERKGRSLINGHGYEKINSGDYE